VIQNIYRIFDVVLPGVTISEKEFGWNGYPQSAALNYFGMPVGLLAWGAVHGRNFVSFSGAGCSRVNDWTIFFEILTRYKARITRIDLAFDLYNGEITYEQAEAAAFPNGSKTAGGEFVNPRGGPKRLSFKRFASGGKFGNEGRTLYIGGAKSSKHICIYEKGHEVYGKLPHLWASAAGGPGTAAFADDRYGCPSGTEVSNWLRLEVRYNSKDRTLPPEMLIFPDRYFAGAYPFCARALGRGDGISPPTLMSNAQATLEKLTQYARVSYGPVFYALHTVSNLSKEEIFDRMVRPTISKKLRTAGLLAEDESAKPF
jgi:phage replication initiation protein